jgi:anthranilate synthase component 1
MMYFVSEMRLVKDYFTSSTLSLISFAGLRNLSTPRYNQRFEAFVLHFPDFQHFSELARAATLVPVAKTISADLLTPVSAFLALAEGEKHAILLESVEGGEKIGRYTFLGIRPYMIFRASSSGIEIERRGKREKLKGDLFAELNRIFSSHRPAKVEGLPPFTCGAVGYFSYDVVRRLEKLPKRAKDDLKLPDCALMFFDRLLAFDHVRQQIHIIATADVSGNDGSKALRQAYEAAVTDIVALEKKLARGVPKAANRRATSKPIKIKHTTGEKDFLRSVERVKKYIAAGDVFQCVLSQRLELEPQVEPFAIYRALRTINPSPYMYFLQMDGVHVLGSSPEMLVKVTQQVGKSARLEYRPIAGTRPRGKTEAEDLRLEAELRADEKERAEHVMLVDLGRNDLGRVSQTGTVRVKDLMFVERYSHVMHMVSALEGTLRGDLTPLDAFSACFPAGTLSGAPKVRAMQIIEELEPTRRGVYGGSVFYADFAGNLDSCIAIRTMLMKGRKAYVQAGAGIVADSVPKKEHEECLNKAKALLRAVQVASSS